MFMSHANLYNNRGDTIVEVLIAVAVVSLVVATAYAVVNKSVTAIQSAQEQSYAQKLVEQQVELLRTASSAPSTLGGCYTQTAAYSLVPADCTISNGGATYTISITKPAGDTAYTIRAVWETPGGQQARVSAYYIGATP